MGNYFVVFRKISIFASWYSAFCWICGHTLYGCVDWNCSIERVTIERFVTPCMGVWIETSSQQTKVKKSVSHPVWVCGLKLRLILCVCLLHWSHPVWVCGLKLPQKLISAQSSLSHPVWVCGLKQVKPFRPKVLASHTLYGCVDWNLQRAEEAYREAGHTLYGCVDWNVLILLRSVLTVSHTLYGCVDWNWAEARAPTIAAGHTLYGCVDWNIVCLSIGVLGLVTPCMGVWIETFTNNSPCLPPVCHTLYGCVDWNMQVTRNLAL